MLIQACQVSNSVNGLSQKYRRFRDDSNIILTRENTLLLLATVTGGQASRGAFTGALAEQISHANGEGDIYKLYTQACQQMDKPEMPWGKQTPEMRSTLKTHLVI